MKSKILQQYNLQLKKTVNGHTINGHWLSNYIYIFRDKDDVTEFIHDLDLAINNQFNQIEDPEWGVWLGWYYSCLLYTSPSPRDRG